MQLPTDLTQKDLEQVYASISQQLNVLVQEQQHLNEAMERLANNLAVIGALIELKAYKEQVQEEIKAPIEQENKPTMTPQEYEAYLAKQKAKR